MGNNEDNDMGSNKNELFIRQLYELKGATEAHERITEKLEKSLLAPRLNVFEMIDSVHREAVVHTPFLKNLLDPAGQHGLGTRPLKIFLRELFKAEIWWKDKEDDESGNVSKDNKTLKDFLEKHPPVFQEEHPSMKFFDEDKDSDEDKDFDSYKWSVRREQQYPKSDGSGKEIRFDLIIEGEADSGYGLLIIVENKIGAHDEEEQIDGYFSWLCDSNSDPKSDPKSRRVLKPKQNRWLVFLTPHGIKPEKAKNAACALMSYCQHKNKPRSASMERVITKIMQEVPFHSRIRNILEQYLEAIEIITTFPNDPSNNDTEEDNAVTKTRTVAILNNWPIFQFWYKNLYNPKTKHYASIPCDLKKIYNDITSPDFRISIQKEITLQFSKELKKQYEKRDNNLPGYLIHQVPGAKKLTEINLTFTDDLLENERKELWLPQVIIFPWAHDGRAHEGQTEKGRTEKGHFFYSCRICLAKENAKDWSDYILNDAYYNKKQCPPDLKKLRELLYKISSEAPEILNDFYCLKKSEKPTTYCLYTTETGDFLLCCYKETESIGQIAEDVLKKTFDFCKQDKILTIFKEIIKAQP